MSSSDHRFSCVVLGEQSLLIQCCEALLARGHEVRAVVAENRRIAQWCEQKGIACFDEFNALREAPQAATFDFLMSITNLRMLPPWLLERPAKMSVNFHDGPLPAYAGLNAPVWALINGETEYGITWHEMAAGVDKGRILVQRGFPVTADETVLGLNAQCYQAGLAAFNELIEQIETGSLAPQEQDSAQRSYFGLSKRPSAAATLDWSRPAVELERLVRALDFGRYANPVILPKVDLGEELLCARAAELAPEAGAGAPGSIVAFCASTLTVRCGEGALKILRLTDLRGEAVDVATTLAQLGLSVGATLPGLVPHADALSETVTRLCKHEEFWERRLRRMEPIELPFAAKGHGQGAVWKQVPVPGLAAEDLIAALGLLFGRLARKNEFSLAYVPAAAHAEPEWFTRYFTSIVPLPIKLTGATPFAEFRDEVARAVADSEAHVGYLNDLPAREPELRAFGDCAAFPIRIVRSTEADELTARRHCGAAALTLVVGERGEAVGLLADQARLDREGLARLVDALGVLAEAIRADRRRPVGRLPVLSQVDRVKLDSWNPPYSEAQRAALAANCVHQQFEAQAARTPDREAVNFEGRSMSYAQLNAAANRLARHLQKQGVQRGDLVGVMVGRSLEMVVALYGVHKAGAAYVPLDPVYPRDRLAYMISDAGLKVVVTQRQFADMVGSATRVVLEDDVAALAAQPADNLDVGSQPSDLAYVIYTSGSTGKPKGVMVEHGNVVNFFTGMDDKLETEPGVWLAVTSISFDISVLELFWTLARGFTVILYADAVRQKVARARPMTARAKPLDFGFFYWNVANDESEYDQDKYRLLLESAKYADANGFNSVWTPERHFAAFGGLFPNPSVTSAALATITKNVALRAGSCVVPLHSPIRIAEEWAVVDNLSNGRVGMSIAAGWAPPDFAIRPEAFANAKQVMFESAEIVKKLWRGETVEFPGPGGKPVKVRTLPRPIQKELPIWVTTAGNIDTYVSAGKAGANLLTHLLGQTVEEVTEKVKAYRQAWTDAGHAGRGTVTLMLHTLVGPDPAAVEKVVRQPLKEYLKTAMFLVKAAAWNFPTFKKLSEEQGKTLDDFFANIAPEDMDGLLDFAFERYFHTSGLFGTPEQCMGMIERVEGADVDEIACLIDFGIKTETVLEHLPYLNQLRALAQSTAQHDADYSLPALFARHPVSHFQCTPSMATMLVSDPSAKTELAKLKQMMVGGEAFPPELARELKGLVKGRVTNMYGPTETTIWSSVGDVGGDTPLPVNNVSIGRPLANQTIYVLDENQQPMPPGLPGELVIGGAGVVRGYWQRPELTAERFLPDPFATARGARMYRTGDLARFLPDGRIECMGRVDHQVKIRGYRVELGEIEALLRAHDQVREAAVILREDTPGDQRLVGYVRSVSGAEVPADTLKIWLRQQLPEFMVPSGFVNMAELPLTPNGKLDRKALPAPQLAEATSENFVAPASDAEAAISAIWQRALGVSKVGTRDNFFDIGGHSLLVVQVLKEMREAFPKPIQMTDLFRHTTIEALAKFVSGEVEQSAAAKSGKARAEARRAAMGRRGA
jgi:natural product biosynthesis luciferase-like monooxygenase protein